MKPLTRLMQAFMRLFFRLLYHPFAFAYDFVAASVSFGQWRNWIAETLPFIEGTRVLELGHGPGHLQLALRDRGFVSYGLDESQQMGRIAARRLGVQRLARGLAQDLPYANETFDTVVATFPTEYIFDPQTLLSVKRVLRNGGRLVVLPVTFPKNGFLKWLYKVTGESPVEMSAALQARFRQPFINAGFGVDVKLLESAAGVLLVILANKFDESGWGSR